MGGAAAARALGGALALMLEVSIRRKSVPSGAGEREVISDVSFAVGPREIVALVGPSGCGKTTILRIVAGLDQAFEGEVCWDGGARKRLGAVFQDPLLLPWRTVRDNLALVRPPDPALPARMLEALGVAHAAELYPRALSLGMARRVALARAFSVAPDLLLLDEPFVSLDPVAAAQARHLFLRTWQSHACAALLVTHDRAEAEALADRILLLSANPCRVARIVEIETPRRPGDAT